MKNLKKALAVSCAGLLLFAPYNYPVFPEILTAYADHDLSSLTENLTINSSEKIYGNVTNHRVIINGDCTVTLENVSVEVSEFSPAIEIKSGEVTIILIGTNTLNGWAGIEVDKGATLTIQGGGTLEATGSCTGIGGEGNIIINSGTINATGGDGAGIGGTNQTNPGNVTISGGAVTATSAGGAGIGAGAQPYGKVTITGGVVTATSTNGAGIGDSQSKNCSGVEIGKFATVHSTGLLGKNGISANGGEPDIAEGATIRACIHRKKVI